MKRRDPLPEGVADQLEFFMGGGPECGNPQLDPPQVVYPRAVEEIPSKTQICLGGFDVGEPLTLTITPPVGKTATLELPPTDDADGFTYRYPRIPGVPIGTYHVTAEQNDLVATREFNVQRATRPRLWVDRRHDATPGDEIHVYVGGFTANRTERLDLYGGGNPATYRTSFPIQVDQHGEGHAVIETKPDDTEGCYGISHPLLYTDDSANDAFCIAGRPR